MSVFCTQHPMHFNVKQTYSNLLNQQHNVLATGSSLKSVSVHLRCLFSYMPCLFELKCLFCEQLFSVSLIDNAVAFFRKLRCSIDPSQRRRVLLSYHCSPLLPSSPACHFRQPLTGELSLRSALNSLLSLRKCSRKHSQPSGLFLDSEVSLHIHGPSTVEDIKFKKRQKKRHSVNYLLYYC